MATLRSQKIERDSARFRALSALEAAIDDAHRFNARLWRLDASGRSLKMQSPLDHLFRRYAARVN
jgi:hypothetical protein